jgi:type IV secretion system protein VirB10
MTDPTEAPQAAGDAPALERGISPIAGRLAFGRAGKAATVAALAAGCGLFLLATARHPQARAPAPQAPARQVVAFEPAQTGAAPTLAQPGPDAPSLTTGGAGDRPPVPALDPATAAGPAAAQPDGRDAPILAFSRSGEAALPAATAPALARLPETTELDRLRQGSRLGMAHATRLPNRDFLILAGTTIPCVLQTAMDTATPGYVSCVVPSDVYSDNGAVVLLEKGARVLGEYRGGMKQGQNRLFVLWTRAVTPGGVAIALTSPATDALGRTGFDGDVDSHFWQRFGGAILLSVIDGGLSALGRASGSISLQAPSRAADTALQASAGVNPTLRKAPGAEVAIFAAEDFDFSGVYGVKAR